MSVARHDNVSQNILKTLLYFDIFNYPLESKEVYHFLQSNHVTEKIINEKLHQLADEGLTYKFGKFFSLHNNDSMIDRRIRGNQEALRFMELARRQAQLINRFPFVRAVMASGSLSKGYMDETCDLDFFVVTKANRLWIARTLLVLYKRLFLKNSHKYFCVNYFIDENNLEIEEKNLFTATELTTLVPLSGDGYQHRLMNANTWVRDFLPNHRVVNNIESKEEEPRLKKFYEGLLNILIPSLTNTILMNLTLRRWKRLYAKKYDSGDFKIAFKTKKNESKNHPNYYQKRVMELYREKKETFSRQHSMTWIA